MTNTLKKSARNSNIEIVRILAMLMIILSHIYGKNSGEEFSGIYQTIFVFTASVFNGGLGVIIFMLISGYFLIHYSTQRLTKIISMTLCCSVCSLIIDIIYNRAIGITDISLMNVLRHIIPISSRYYWYMSCYVCVMVLAPFFNKAIHALSKKDFEKLILVMLAVFYILPTFLYYDIMNDRGKGLVTMISAYFIGAYLSKYRLPIDRKKSAVLLTAVFLFIFAGNYAATLVRGETSYPFSRECTITTLIAAILIIQIATEKSSVNKGINAIASKTLYIYILSGCLTNIISKYSVTEKYSTAIWLVFLTFAMSCAVFALCYLLSLVLQYPAMLADKLMFRLIEWVKTILFKSRLFNEIKVKYIK